MSEQRDVRRLHLVQQLAALPRELVDKIFNNLTVFKILQLATFGDPVITECILEHKHYGRTFSSTDQLREAASRFTIWHAVKIASRRGNSRHLLALNPTSSLFAAVTYQTFMDNMILDIKEGYQQASAYMPLLSQYSPERILHCRCWVQNHIKWELQKIWTAQESIKRLESRQLTILADFFETYPDMLRWTQDPRGNASAIPPEHIVEKLRSCSKKVSNTEYIRRRRPVHCKFLFRNGILPIVPRDWCLQLLLESDLPIDVTAWEAANLLAARPAAQQERIGEMQLKNAGQAVEALTRHDSATSRRAGVEEVTDSLQHTSLAFPLPSHGTEDLHTALSGLRHMYARPGHMIDGTPIIRISTSDHFDIKDWFSRSCEERKLMLEHRRPHFLIPPRLALSQRAQNAVTKEKDTPARWRKVNQMEISSVQPYHPQELEWLGAFLRSIALLRRNNEHID